MQASEEEMRPLRRAIRYFLDLIGWPRGAEPVIASAGLAGDVGMPDSEVRRILDRTAADLHRLSEDESEDVDARPIIDRAVSELSKLSFQSHPLEEAAIERYLQELPDRDYQILRQFKLGKKHIEIASLLNISVEDVRDSLVKTYAELRLKMIGTTGDGGGGEPCEVPPPSKTYSGPIKQTSVHH